MHIVVKDSFKAHLFVFTFLSFFFFFFSQAEIINGLLAFAACFGVLIHLKNIEFRYPSRTELAVFVIFNAYITFAIFGYDLFISNSMSTEAPLNIFSFILGFIWSGYFLQSVLDFTSKLGDTAVSKNSVIKAARGRDYWLKWLLFFVIVFATLLIWQRAYIITMPPDSFDYANGWYGGVYSANRSPLYAFLINVVCTLVPIKPEVQSVIFVQMILFSSLLASVMMYLHKRNIKYKHLIIASFILPLIPSYGLHTISLLSDLACGMSVLWLTYVVARIIDEVLISDTAVGSQKISFCVQLLISMVFVFFIRSNSFPVFIVMIPALIILIICFKKPMFLIPIILSVVSVIVLWIPGYGRIIDKMMDNNQKYYAALHDMQYTYYNQGELSENTINSLKKYIEKIDDPDLKNRFIPDVVQHNEYKYNAEGLTTKEFISMYMDALLRNPVAMLESMFNRQRMYWVIDTKAEIIGVNYTDVHIYSRDSYWRQLSSGTRVFKNENFLKNILDRYILYMNGQLPATFVWRYGIWSALMAVSVMTLILKKRYLLLFSYLPVATYVAALFLSNGWNSYRYGLPVLFVALFLPFAFLSVRGNANTKFKDGNK